MAKKQTIDLIIKTFRELGGNVSDVLGSRTNINFLGIGDNVEPFLDKNLNTEALGVLSQSKAIDEAKGAVGFAVSDKLNDIQANNLLTNLNKMKEFYMPPAAPANIIDMGTGIRNLDQEGLGSLRAEEKLADDVMANVSDAEYTIRGYFPKASDAEIKQMLDKPSKKVMEILDVEGVDLPPGVDPRDTILPMSYYNRPGFKVPKGMDPEDLREIAPEDLPPPGSRGGPNDIAAPFVSADETIKNLRIQDPDLANQVRTMVDEGIISTVGNQGGNPAKRGAAREFLVEALKKDEYDVGTAAFGKTNLNNVISAEDVKYITEGGGGIGGDPILLVEKYFGPRIAEAVPSGASSEEIMIFTKRVLENVEDASGLKPDHPKFDSMTARFVDVEQFAAGGRAGFFGGGLGRLGKMGYQALRKHGLEAEDITNLFKSLGTDKTLVGKEKTQYFRLLHKVLKNPDEFPEAILDIKKKLGLPYAAGGRVAFQGGGMDAGAGSDFGKEDYGTTTTTTTNNNNNNNNDNNNPPVTFNTVVESRDIPVINKSIPTAVGLEALLADKGKFQAVFDAEEAAKDLDLGAGAMLSYDGSIGPIDVNAMTNLSGDKNLNLGYQTKGGTNIGLETDLGDNAMFKISKTFAKGGLAKILEV